jgi:hypothetical protein
MPHGIFSYLLGLGSILLGLSNLFFQILYNLCGFLEFLFEILGTTDGIDSGDRGKIDSVIFRRVWVPLRFRPDS